MKHLGTLLCALILFSYSTRASADNPNREFLMSCTYGVLTGTLVGIASLAFVKNPGHSLNRVARGASFGLYAGILLGLYVVYIVPGIEAGPEEEPTVGMIMRNLDVAPTVSPRGMDGMTADWTITRF